MIGRQDVLIATPARSRGEVLDDLVRCLGRVWPKAIVQDALSGTRFPSYGSIPFEQLKEVFVYRDDQALEAWMELGADVSNANTMVHLIASDSSVTLVVDDPEDRVTRSFLSEARDLLAPWGLAA